jgi:hypothetical protein
MAAFSVSWLYVLYGFQQHCLLQLILLIIITFSWQRHLEHHVWLLSADTIYKYSSNTQDWQLQTVNKLTYEAVLMASSSVFAGLLILHFRDNHGRRTLAIITRDNVTLENYKKLRARIKFTKNPRLADPGARHAGS